MEIDALNAPPAPAMSHEAARAMISNPDGWSREDILKAAKVLKDTVAINLHSSVEPKLRQQKRDHLLVEMAQGVEYLCRVAERQWPENGSGAGIARIIQEARILFNSTLDR